MPDAGWLRGQATELPGLDDAHTGFIRWVARPDCHALAERIQPTDRLGPAQRTPRSDT